MFDNIKKLREIRRDARNAAAVEYDAAGKEMIRMTVANDDGFLSPYALNSESVIASDVSEFLDYAIKGMPLKNDVHIEITGSTIDDGERVVYASALKNRYRSRVVDIDRQLKRNSAAAIWMTVVAALILALYVTLEILGANYILLEIIDIIAWVFMWEAADIFFLERSVLKIEQLRACRLYDAELTFVRDADETPTPAERVEQFE